MVTYNNSCNLQATEYNVLSGGVNNTFNNIPPGASGTVLVSNGASSQPSFQTISTSAFPWSVVSGTSQACLITNGYIASNSSLTDMYLPATASVGNELKFSNIGSGYNILPAPGQTISFLNQSATFPNYLQTTVANAALDIVCTNANTSWNVINNEGTYTTVSQSFQASFGGSTLYYLKQGGSAWASGLGTDGQLGNNTSSTSVSSPVAVVGSNVYTQIQGTYSFAIALRNDGTAWAWGYNVNGQLGNNTQTNYSSPISVVGNFSFIQVAAGGSFSSGTECAGALTSSGALWLWGDNLYGQLGNNTRTAYSSPISVVGGFDFTQFCMGVNYTLALASNGSVWAWGANGYGQLGNNTTTSHSSPVSVVGGFSFIQISTGYASSYGLMSNGSVWAWGYNMYGQLGNETLTSYSSPVSVVGNFSFIQIAANYCALYGLTSAGQIWCCGDNGAGQLGNNTQNSYSSPISVVGNFSFVQLANIIGTGDDTTSSIGAWTSNGQLYAWGANGGGQLGNNTQNSYSSPILVLNTP